MTTKSIFALLPSFILAMAGFFAINFWFAGLSAAFTFAVGVIAGALLTLPCKKALSSARQQPSGQSATLYVGNLPYRANEAAVRELFAKHTRVYNVRLLKDRQTGKRRGFGFVEIAAADMDKVIDALNDKEFMQRTLKVREAKNQPQSDSVQDASAE